MEEIVEALERFKGLVPLVYDIETMGLEEARPVEYEHSVYLKREADRVIDHQKYKRCMANAKICHMAWWHAKWDKKPDFQIIHHWRWWNIWLELADNFKEAK